MDLKRYVEDRHQSQKAKRRRPGAPAGESYPVKLAIAGRLDEPARASRAKLKFINPMHEGMLAQYSFRERQYVDNASESKPMLAFSEFNLATAWKFSGCG